jgi:protein-disulfide isomerase
MSVIQETTPQQETSRTQPTQGIWQSMSPRIAFIFGLVTAIAASSVIGLIIVISLLMRGGGSSVLAAAPSPSQVAAAPTAPTPSAQPPVAAAAGTVKPVDPKTDHIRGDKNAKVFVIEYSDFECPFCKRHHPTMQQLMTDYGGKVAWVYRQYPLSFHQNAQKEAEASECAAELGGNDAFWKFTDKIFERTTSNGTGFALDALGPLAKEIGLNQQAFQKCLDSGKYAAKVAQDEQEGQAAGVSGTPGNIVWTKDGKSQLVEGAVPLQSLKSVIDPLLK